MNLTSDKQTSIWRALQTVTIDFTLLLTTPIDTDGSGAIENISLGTNTGFTSFNSTIAFAEKAIFCSYTKKRYWTNRFWKKMVNFPTGNSILSFGKKLGFRLDTGM